MKLVAEVGCNWNGNMETAQALIKEAKASHFDAVKFTVFNKKHWGKYPQYPTLKSNTLTKGTIPEVYAMCKKEQIEFFATPCFPMAVGWLDPYVKRFKIRYADRWDIPLYNKIAKTHKPAYVSGRRTWMEGWQSLYCVPKYPTLPHEIDWGVIEFFDGYSCHCTSPVALTAALKLKLDVYEFHMVLYHSEEWIDNMVSFDFKEFEGILH